MLKDLVYSCRSYRRFYEDVRISDGELRQLVDLARMTGATANFQALKFRLVNNPEDNAKVYRTLKWAGALPDWDGPQEGERPAAYVIVLCDTTIAKSLKVDVGITSQTMMLGAVEMGYGGCMLASVNREKLAEELAIDTERYTIELVLALGKPKEEVKVVPIPEDGSVKYYRDAQQVHYVPKRSLEDILL